MIFNLNIYSSNVPVMDIQITFNSSIHIMLTRIHLFNQDLYEHLLCSRHGSRHLGYIRKQSDKKTLLLLEFTIQQKEIENKHKDSINK